MGLTPLFFISVASKGLSVHVSGLESTLTDSSISVDSKRLVLTFRSGGSTELNVALAWSFILAKRVGVGRKISGS